MEHIKEIDKLTYKARNRLIYELILYIALIVGCVIFLNGIWLVMGFIIIGVTVYVNLNVNTKYYNYLLKSNAKTIELLEHHSYKKLEKHLFDFIQINQVYANNTLKKINKGVISLFMQTYAKKHNVLYEAILKNIKSLDI